MAEEEEEKKGGGKNLIIIIVAIIVVVLLLIGGILAFLLSGDEEEMPMPPPSASVQNPQGNTPTGIPNPQVTKNYIKVGPLYQGIGLLTTNLSSRKGKRYLRVQLDLELDSDNVIGELDSKLPVVKDIILGILGSKSTEDLTTIKGKNRTKQEIIATLNKSLIDGKINDIFFQEFIIQ